MRLKHRCWNRLERERESKDGDLCEGYLGSGQISDCSRPSPARSKARAKPKRSVRQLRHRPCGVDLSFRCEAEWSSNRTYGFIWWQVPYHGLEAASPPRGCRSWRRPRAAQAQSDSVSRCCRFGVARKQLRLTQPSAGIQRMHGSKYLQVVGAGNRFDTSPEVLMANLGSIAPNSRRSSLESQPNTSHYGLPSKQGPLMHLM